MDEQSLAISHIKPAWHSLCRSQSPSPTPQGFAVVQKSNWRQNGHGSTPNIVLKITYKLF